MSAAVDTQRRERPAEAAQEAGATSAAPASPGEVTEQHLTAEQPSGADELARVVAERDEYLEALQRLQAEYENYRRRTQRELADAADHGGRRVAERLLEVLDGFDAAVSHGVHALAPLRRSLQDALTTAGLQRIEPAGDVFDPAEHQAVTHETAAGTDEAASADSRPTVVQVLRPGYRWKGRLVRPALVHVRG